MKKRTIKLFHTIEFFIISFAIVVFLLANPTTLNYFAKEITTTYDLKYKSLSGNLLKNIHIKNLIYKGKTLAKDAEIDFNLLKFLILKIDIESIKFSKVDIKNLKYFINSISNEKKSTSNEKFKLPFFISVHDIYLDILPYQKDSLKIEKLKLYIKDFEITNDIVINELKVDLKSNYFNLNYNGSYSNKHLYIENFNLEKLDIKKVLLLRNIIKQDSDSNESIIKTINIKSANLSILPYSKGHYKIKNLKASIKNLKSDLKIFNAKDVNLKIDTNIWKLNSKGSIKNSTFLSKVKINLNDKYMKKFLPFMNFNSLNPVDVTLKIDKDKLIGDLRAKSNNLLAKNLKFLNLKLKNLKTHAVFNFKDINLFFNTKAKFDSKYSKNFLFDGNFTYDKKHFLNYNGNMKFKDFKNIDKRVAKLLTDTKIDFLGDTKGIHAKLYSKYLKADYNSTQNFLTPKISVISKEFNLSELDKNISTALKDIKSAFILETTIDYKNIKNTKINYQIDTNAVNFDGEYFVKTNSLNFVSTLPKNSILKDQNNSIDKIFPINSKVNIKNKDLDISLKSDDIEAKLLYNTNSQDFDLDVKGFDTQIKAKNKNKNITYTINTTSLKSLLQGIDIFYHIPDLKSDGELMLVGSYRDNIFDFNIDSKWFLTEYSQYKYLFLENTVLNASYQNRQIFIDNYFSSAYILDNYRKLYSNNISTISFLNNKITLNFLLNDSIRIKGDIADKTNLRITANNYHINEPEADIFINTDIKYFSTKNYSSLNGAITLLSGIIKYKPKTTHEIDDKDIIFVNKKRVKVVKSKNQNIDIKIYSQKPLYYQQGKNKIKFTSNLRFLKTTNKNIQLNGIITIIDGVYFSDEKRFELGRGNIRFSGDMKNPYLDLKAYYRKDPYDITIMIGGELNAPQLNFSSTPYLTQNDILSILLFNTKASSLTNSNSNNNPALTLFGSSFAKGILDTIGVKLDRVVLSTKKDGNLGFEVEKRLNDKTTIIYQNDLVQTIKLRYKNTQDIETDITFSPDSSSIDIIYKNEK